MKKPVLVILAAGMGSRYGGLKQIDPIDNNGHLIIDFAIYDARRAGFEKVVFIIKKEDEADFMEAIGNRIANYMDVDYAYQDLNAIPEGYTVPEGRDKPWGTAQALVACKGIVDGPFAVINADDYYGAHAFQTMYDYLMKHGEEPGCCGMVGYVLKNTLSDNGHVSRGVCVVDENHHLCGIDERKKIIKTEKGSAYTLDDGETWIDLPPQTIVSMNLWGFSVDILDKLEEGLPAFLDEAFATDPLKAEYLLPTKIGEMLQKGEITVDVMQSLDRWYGVTYRADKPGVTKALQGLKDVGLYPQKLWADD